MSQYIEVCRRNFTCFRCGRFFILPEPPESPPVSKKIKISDVKSLSEANTLDSITNFEDLVVSNLDK